MINYISDTICSFFSSLQQFLYEENNGNQKNLINNMCVLAGVFTIGYIHLYISNKEYEHNLKCLNKNLSPNDNDNNEVIGDIDLVGDNNNFSYSELIN